MFNIKECFADLENKCKANQRKLNICISTVLMLASAAIVMTNNEVYGVIAMVFVFSVTICLTDDILLCLLPLLLTSVFVTRCYDSFDTFIVFWWVVFPLVASIIIHFVRFFKKPRIGISFYGMCLVSFALILGGFGTISAEEYFKPMTLYYTLGLGLGMLLAYLLFQPFLHEEGQKSKLFVSLYLMGILAAFCVFRFYAADIETVIRTKKFIAFQSSNNLATVLMITLPIPMYYASKNRLHLLSALVMFVAMVLTASRGGVALGSVEALICMVLFAVKDRHCRYFYISGLAAVVAVLLIFKKDAFVFFGIKPESFSNIANELENTLIRKNETRYIMIANLKNDFSSNMLFGTGLGYTGNAMIYSPKSGGMAWYHMWFPQIVGSMGIFGVLSYGINMVARVFLVLRQKSLYALTVGMSYMGLFLMSQVNPGEFCPLPYALIAVLMFLTIEKYPER